MRKIASLQPLYQLHWPVYRLHIILCQYHGRVCYIMEKVIKRSRPKIYGLDTLMLVFCRFTTKGYLRISIDKWDYKIVKRSSVYVIAIAFIYKFYWFILSKALLRSIKTSSIMNPLSNCLNILSTKNVSVSLVENAGIKTNIGIQTTKTFYQESHQERKVNLFFNNFRQTDIIDIALKLSKVDTDPDFLQ